MMNLVFKYYRFLILYIFFLFSVIGYSQPKSWISKEPVSIKNSKGPFKYFVGSGSNYEEAQLDAIESIAKDNEVIISSEDIKSETRIGLEKITENKETTSIEFPGKTIDIIFLEQGRNGSTFYALYATKTEFYKVNDVPGRLPSSKFIVRSSIVPGWGQIYNKEYFKGLGLLAAEIGLLSGTFYSFSMASNEAANAELALINGSISQYNAFQEAQNRWNIYGTVFSLGAVAVWVLNIIDAASTEKNLYVRRKSGGLHLYASATQIGLGIKF